MNDFSFCETIKIDWQETILRPMLLKYFGTYIGNKIFNNKYFCNNCPISWKMQ